MDIFGKTAVFPGGYGRIGEILQGQYTWIGVYSVKAENMPSHMVKTVFKYSFKKRRYGVLKMSASQVAETLNF